MQEITTQKEIKTISFNEKEQQQILNRIFKKRESDLNTYWDYRDCLNEEQLLKILLEEEGLNDVENEIFEHNPFYISEEVYKILDEELNEEEKTDEDLRDFLRIELESYWNINLKDLIKNSEIRLLITLQTNEDFISLKNYKQTETYNFFKERFKGIFKVKDLNNEIESVIGTDYGHIVFFFKAKGERILSLREQIKNGYIEITPDIYAGVHNYWVGAGGDLNFKLKKPIKLNLKDWRISQEEQILKNLENPQKSYYSVSIRADNLTDYGINKTYGLISSCWVEW